MIFDIAAKKPTDARRSNKSEKIRTLEVARGIAALLVAFYHGSHVVQLFKEGWGAPFGGLFSFGHAGVPFFFVLSGFIIFSVHRRDLDCPSRFTNFVWRRATRIYPLFLVVMIPITLKYLAVGAFDLEYFIKSLLLLPQSKYPMLIPSWTLVHEALFYMLFGLTILNLRLSRFVLFAWLTLFCAVKWFEPDLGSGFAADVSRTVFSNYNVLFLVGIAVCSIIQHKPVPYSRILACLGLLGFFSTGMAENAKLFVYSSRSDMLPVLMYGLSAALIILSLVSAELTGSIRMSRLANLLGSLSYPLYLTHGITISIVVSIFGATQYQGPGWIMLVTAVAMACVAAMLVHRYVELPMATYLKTVWHRRQWLRAIA